MSKPLRRQLPGSLRNDCDQRWVEKRWEVKKAAAIGNDLVIRNTDPMRSKISKVIGESDNTLVHLDQRGLEGWIGNFRDKFSWTTTVSLTHMTEDEATQVDTSNSPEMEVFRTVGLLKKQKTTRPDRLSPFFFNNGGVNIGVNKTLGVSLIKG